MILTPSKLMCMISKTTKLAHSWTFTDKIWLGQVKLMCITMSDVYKIMPKSMFGLVKDQKC